MKLIECYIENFGKLRDFRCKFSDGLNTLKQDNGYGKTTLTVFIKAMLYGLDDTRRMRLDGNDRKHYLPWSGGVCGGSLTFEAGGKKYRIERRFMQKASDDSFALYDLRTGKICEDFSAALGEELFGIDQDGFERTVFLSEANLSGKNENKSISAKLSDLVGCDGDIGVMDEAIESLEKQRKIYRKRGGAGEIGDIKKRISELDHRINELERMESELHLGEKELVEKKHALRSLYAKKQECEEKNRLLGEARLKKNYEKQYLEMKDAVKTEEENLSRLSEFFKLGVPTHREIEEARELYSTARITLAKKSGAGSGQLFELENFFASGISDEMISCATARAANESRLRVEAKRAELDAAQNESRAQELPSCSPEDIDLLTKEIALSKKANKSWRILIPLGILTSVLIFGIFLLIAGIKGYRRDKSSLSLAEAKERAESLLDDSTISMIDTKDALVERLYAERAHAVKARELREEAKALTERAEALIEKADAELREIYEFISKFPPTNANTPGEAISLIERKYALYKALSDSLAASDKIREQEISEAKAKAARAAEFISRFPTASERPFDEITARLLEYSSLLSSTGKMRDALARFASEHKIDTSALARENFEPISADVDTTLISEEILNCEREKTLLERKLKTLSDELETKDELVAERDELRARAGEYESRLNVILKTMTFLEAAKDSLTSRYLSGTKAAFDKYVSLIGLESGEDFTMDTSFTVMKNEHGTLRQTEAYSRGTRELYALSARLALVDSLYEKERPFIILDDPFAYFDDAKLSRALSVIKAAAKEKQIIYLTCSESRRI